MDKPLTFGNYLRSLRESSGKGLCETARAIGISGAYLSQVERGIVLPFSQKLIDRVGNYFRVDAMKLHCLAAKERDGFWVEMDLVPESGSEFLSSLACGNEYPDAFWRELKQLARRYR